ncbi:adenosylcobinamide-GDP ribazoletransferase [Thiocapsa imhoffii]|uniref:Adenosylcobinamide-GDP ribazoletransferase n=1 Tax=Thiocapsa imhoffii TaxID=382777 RepID=A0A9X1B6U4_9GAMM|nr:adenosylcobinamide-GDP ribazoletransferase [Thiocapsa imhoffii]MBK1643114.1 adenosylcobinamide-GDP ribazoletransferase [Thiocapsa imhoffii]
MDVRPFWLAGRFLTRWPFPEPAEIAAQHAGQAVPWYPAIGLLLGLTLVLGLFVLEPVDAGVAAAVILLLWVWSTGILHLDGLADSADAWIGGLMSRERTLEIMKDPRSGPAAITAIGLVLIGKWSGLQALIASGPSVLLILIPMLARALLALLLLTTPYARDQGMASAALAHLPRRPVWIAVVLSGIACVLIGGWIGLGLVGLSGLLFLSLRRLMLRRIGGFTGDTAGALVEISETLLLLAMMVLLAW